MTKLEEMLGGYEIPKVAKVKQFVDETVLEKPEQKLIDLICSKDIVIKPGSRIAITGGSRSVAGYQLTMKTLVSFVKARGGVPFIVPAMGSHGGGTAEGQVKMLRSLGITEASVGAPIVSCMDVVEVGRTELGLPVYIDKAAYEADGIILLNRVKTHTSIREKYQSGLLKMLAIGLAKHKGALMSHSFNVVHLGPNMIRVGKVALKKTNVLFGVSIIENGCGQLADVYVSLKHEILDTEPKILERAKSMIPQIFLDEIDCLVVYEQGKDISGNGMDPAIVGRMVNRGHMEGPVVESLGVLRLTEKTAGNANGCGLADFITQRLRDSINEEYTMVNSLTGMLPVLAKIPLTLATDKLVFQGCVKTCGQIRPEDIKMVIIRSTKYLSDVYMSEAAVKAVKQKDKIEVCSDYQDVPFDNEGTLTLFGK